MKQIARCDWLPERARWSHLTRSGPPAVSRMKNFPESLKINPLLTKFVRSRWLDIGLLLFLRVYGPRLRLGHKHAKKELGQYPAILTSHLVNNPYCIRLARRKFELTNHDSAGGKTSIVLTLSWNQATFVTRDGIKYPGKEIYNFENQTSWQKVKNMNHFVIVSYFGAKNGSPALCMATRSYFVEFRRVR